MSRESYCHWWFSDAALQELSELLCRGDALAVGRGEAPGATPGATPGKRGAGRRKTGPNKRGTRKA